MVGLLRQVSAEKTIGLDQVSSYFNEFLSIEGSHVTGFCLDFGVLHMPPPRPSTRLRNVNELSLAIGRSVSAIQSMADLDSPNIQAAISNLRTLKRFVNTVDTWHGHIVAMSAIVNAADVLNNRDLIRDDPDAYALAFGQFFVAAGHFVGLLPFPLNQYADFLKGMETFFVVVGRNLTYRGNNSSGREMRGAHAGYAEGYQRASRALPQHQRPQ